MWGKKEQVILWTTSYTPIILIILYRFLNENNLINLDELLIDLKVEVSSLVIDMFVVFIIFIFSYNLYKKVITWILKDNEENLSARKIGRDTSIRKYEKISVNDYTFFLITVLLPLISLDPKSIINLFIALFLIVLIIMIYVKTDTISVCPLFFVSGKNVFRGVLSDYTKEEETMSPNLRKDVIIITSEKTLNLDSKVRVVNLISNVYYVCVTRSDS